MSKYIEISLPNNFGNESRYRIQIEVSDTTDSTRFIIFDKDAEQLIGKTANELADLQDEVTNLEFFRAP
jgi:hypothetical protein